MTIRMNLYTRTPVQFEPVERFQNRNVRLGIGPTIGRAISSRFEKIKISVSRFWESIKDVFRSPTSRTNRRYNEAMETVDRKLNTLADRLATGRASGPEVLVTLEQIQELSGRMDHLKRSADRRIRRRGERGILEFVPVQERARVRHGENIVQERMRALMSRLAQTNPRALRQLHNAFEQIDWDGLKDGMRLGHRQRYEQFNAVLDMFDEPEIPIPNPDTQPYFIKAWDHLVQMRDTIREQGPLQLRDEILETHPDLIPETLFVDDTSPGFSTPETYLNESEMKTQFRANRPENLTIRVEDDKPEVAEKFYTDLDRMSIVLQTDPDPLLLKTANPTDPRESLLQFCDGNEEIAKNLSRLANQDMTGALEGTVLQQLSRGERPPRARLFNYLDTGMKQRMGLHSTKQITIRKDGDGNYLLELTFDDRPNGFGLMGSRPIALDPRQSRVKASATIKISPHDLETGNIHNFTFVEEPDPTYEVKITPQYE